MTPPVNPDALAGEIREELVKLLPGIWKLVAHVHLDWLRWEEDGWAVAELHLPLMDAPVRQAFSREMLEGLKDRPGALALQLAKGLDTPGVPPELRRAVREAVQTSALTRRGSA